MYRHVERLDRHPLLERARTELVRSDEHTLALQSSLSAIPAPTGAETPRAREVGRVMETLGLEDVTTDEAGNVTGWLGERTGKPPVVVAAHLDTVFGHEVDVTVSRSGQRLAGPGIADNARGLAGMLALGRV